MSSVLRSYVKTFVACTAAAAIALIVGAAAWRVLPRALGGIVAAGCAAACLIATFYAVAGIVVIRRHRRGAHGANDLFLALNASREPAAIERWAAPRAHRVRRWLSRRLYGQDLLVGDVVEVKSWDEIRAMLDEQGALDRLPFMPEMLAMCGRRAAVFRCTHRIFDYRKSRRMRHMQSGVLLVGAVCDGSRHGGCQAGCHTIWKPEWLRRVAARPEASVTRAGGREAASLDAADLLEAGTRGPNYMCQLTRLHDASEPVGKWNFAEVVLPVVTGNVAPLAFVVGWLTFAFNGLQRSRGGIWFPAFEQPATSTPEHADVPLAVGDSVVVKSSEAILGTLNDQQMHRGMWFEPDMLKHCRQRYRVQSEIRKLIDIVTGEMRTMKTPAYVLEGVHFSGERQQYNAQHEPLFWRAAWVEREAAGERRVRRDA